MRARLRSAFATVSVCAALSACGAGGADVRVYKGTFTNNSTATMGWAQSVVGGETAGEYVFELRPATDVKATLSGSTLSFASGQTALLAGGDPPYTLMSGSGTMTADQLTFSLSFSSATQFAFDGTRE